MDDIEEINPSVMDCSQKELAFIDIKYPGSEDFIKNKIDFSKFLNFAAQFLKGKNSRRLKNSEKRNKHLTDYISKGIFPSLFYIMANLPFI